jgi:TPR repeat protein/predicted Ser/Thr protein kinase
MLVKPGQQIGSYTVLRELARGGQGVVLEATYAGLDTRVALKLLLDPHPETRARFRQEAMVLARLSHPGLPQIKDLGALPNGVPYMAMEFVRGEDLAEVVRKRGQLDLATVGSVLGSLALTLHGCHEEGIVHRDVKPQNVMLEEGSGRVVLVDFGLIKRDRLRMAWSTQDPKSLTEEGAILGTPAFMAPEQVSSEFGSVDRRSDVYGLGGLLYFLLTGRRPFTGASSVNVLVKVMQADPPDPRSVDPGIPRALAALCQRSMAKDMDARPESAKVFADELRAGLAAPASGASWWRLGGLGAAVVLLLAGGGAWVASSAAEAPPQASSPEEAPPEASPSEAGISAETAYLKGAEAIKEGRFQEAFALFRRAAEGGHVVAMGNLAHMYSRGVGTPLDGAKGVAWLRRAAEAGNQEAMTNLGILLKNGLGAPQNHVEAAAWFRKAADAGEARAMNGMGVMYEEGLGVQPDAAQAAKWYRRAAAADNLNGARNLGLCYQVGRGVPVDDAQAVKYFRVAAEGGHAGAMSNLAICYLAGRGLPTDPTQGVYWLRRAAEEGEASAMNNLARLLEDGRGVAKDEEQAVRWYRRALAKGDVAERESARAALDRLSAR